MVRKGNLLYNGDFEAGTKEGWEHGPYGLSSECDFVIFATDKYRGNYAGGLIAYENFAGSYVAYNKICSFEENEVFLYIIYTKKSYGQYAQPVLFGLDDKGEFIKAIRLAWLTEDNTWKKNLVLLRQFGDISHFKVGLVYKAMTAGDYCIFDEAKLFGYKSIKSLILNDDVSYTDLDADTTYTFSLACIGRCKLVSYLHVTNISGTDASLDVELSSSLIDKPDICYKFSYPTITETGLYVLEKELSEVAWLTAIYDVEGTDRKFTFNHYIRLIPL